MAERRSPWQVARFLALLFLGLVVVAVLLFWLAVSNIEKAAKSSQSDMARFSPGQRVSVVMPSGCATDKADFDIMGRAMIKQDRAVLLPLVEQGRVLLLDGTVRAVVVSVDPTGHRTFIKIESGDHFNVAGKSCEILTEQLQAN